MLILNFCLRLFSLIYSVQYVRVRIDFNFVHNRKSDERELIRIVFDHNLT